MAEGNEPGVAEGGANEGGAGGGSTSWLESLNDDAKGFVANKGWATPQDAIESYRTLESFRGVPEDRLVKLPGDSNPEAWQQVFGKLGRPEEPKGYEVDFGETDPDGSFGEFFRNAAHKANLTAEQAKALGAEFAEATKANMTASQEQTAAQHDEQMRALKQEWGAAFDANMAKARTAAGRLGFDEATVDTLESVMGTAGVLKFVHGLAAKMGEDSFEAGSGSGDYGALAPAQAKARIAELKSDKDWAARYMKGDQAAIAEMERLQRYANGKA